jgi:hypothetical protein
MKSFSFRCALAAVFVCVAAGCSTTSWHSQRFFHDDESVSLVLHFYRWDSIYMTRPDTRQAGFLPVMTRDQIAREIRHRAMRHEVAVVVVGFVHSDAQLAELARDWKQLLGAQGFHRVVLLRAGKGKKIDGLPVIEDSAISSMHDTENRAATLAALAPAAGANVAHPSGPAIR